MSHVRVQPISKTSDCYSLDELDAISLHFLGISLNEKDCKDLCFSVDYDYSFIVDSMCGCLTDLPTAVHNLNDTTQCQTDFGKRELLLTFLSEQQSATVAPTITDALTDWFNASYTGTSLDNITVGEADVSLMIYSDSNDFVVDFDNGIRVHNVSENIFTYSTPGEFQIEAKRSSRDSVHPDVMIDIVAIATLQGNLSLSCNSSYPSVDCDVEFNYGSSVILDINWGDDSETVSTADAIYNVIGPQDLTPYMTAQSGGFYIVSTPVQTKQTIVSIEAYLARTDGVHSFSVMMLRPSCGVGSCPESAWMLTNSTCNYKNSLCTLGDGCSSNCSAGYTHISPSITRFDLVGKSIEITPDPGRSHVYWPLAVPLAVHPGDVLAIQDDNNIVAVVRRYTELTGRWSGHSVLASDLETINTTPAVRAIGMQPSIAILNHVYETNSLLSHVTVKAKYDDPNRPYLTATEEIEGLTTAVTPEHVTTTNAPLLNRPYLTATEEIEGLTVSVSPEHVTVDANFVVNIWLYKGDAVLLECSFGEKQTSMNHHLNDSKELTLNHSYSVPGDYLITIIALNSLNKVATEYLIAVQYPINRNFNISSDSPHYKNNSNINVYIQYPNTLPLPVSAWVSVDWNDPDVTSKETSPLNMTSSNRAMTLQHTYSRPGVFNSVISISNHASSETWILKIGIYEKLESLDIDFRMQSPGGDLVHGFGPNQDVFPSAVPVAVTINIIGTLEDITLALVNQTEIVVCCLTPFPYTLTLDKVGEYNVTAVVINPYSEITTTKKITVVEMVSNVSISDDRTVKPGDAKFFTIKYSSLPKKSCLVIDFGDGSPSKMYGDNTTCLNKYGSAENAYSEVFSLEGGHLVIRHVFISEGLFQIKVHGCDDYVEINDSLILPVTGKLCMKPNLLINSAKNFFKRTESFSIQGSIHLNCSGRPVVQWWTLQADNGSDDIVKDKSDDIHGQNTTEISFDSRSLDIGTYWLSFYVQYNDDILVFISNDKLWSSAKMTFNIVPSDLVVKIVEKDETELALYQKDRLALDVAKYSFDPDLDQASLLKFDVVQWACRNVISPKFSPIVPKTTDGCITGIINHDAFTIHPNGTLEIEGGVLDVDWTYTFRVNVTLGSRTALAQIDVRVQKSRHHKLSISVIGTTERLPNGSRYADVSSSLRLRAQCDPICAPTTNYTWFVKIEDGRGYRTGDVSSHFVTGLGTDHIQIDPALFNTSSDATALHIAVAISGVDGSTGRSALKVLINKAPSGGKCEKPINISQNVWQISCEGWQDQDGVQLLQYYARFKDDPIKRLVISTTLQGRRVVGMPLGPQNDNYTLTLFVKILDTFGCSFTHKIGRIQVYPPENDIIGELNDIVTKYIRTGNIAYMSNVFLSTASLLSYKTNDDESEENSFRETRSQLTSRMVDALGPLWMPDIGSVQLIGSTLTQITLDSSIVNRNSQKKVARKLLNMSQRISALSDSASYNDIVEASTVIVAVAGQVLEAANGHVTKPLQSDVEKTRDIIDYDTDLESEQASYLSLNQEEAIKELMKNENSNLQSLTGKQIVDLVESAMDEIHTTFSYLMIPGEKPLAVASRRMSLYIEKERFSAEKTITTGESKVTFPSLNNMVQSTKDDTAAASIQVYSVPFNIRQFIKKTSALVTHKSASVQIKFINDKQQEIHISNTSSDITILLNQNASESTQDYSTAAKVHPNSATRFHKINITSGVSSVRVGLVNDSAVWNNLTMYMRRGMLPNITTQDWDFSIGLTNDTNTLFEIAKEQLMNLTKGQYYVVFTSDIACPKNGNHTCRQMIKDYNITLQAGGCYFYDSSIKDWSTKGCKIGAASNTSQVVCSCNHLTSFAGGWVVLPNAINWQFVFANADFSKNYALYAMEIVVMVLYVILAIWTKYQDKKDIEKVGVTPLADNNPFHRYLYEVVVLTGYRKGAGTKSKVCFVVAGEGGETDVRHLADDKREILKRGAKDKFIMSSPSSLGPLNYIRVWHDNSGQKENASWFLNAIFIRDLQTNDKFYFVANKWFAVEKSDGQIDRVLPVTSQEEMNEFTYLFPEKTRQNLGDGHLWISVFARPADSNFTRLQRLSCCMTLLFLTMLTNAMYYDKLNNMKQSGFIFSLGSIRLTPEQISVGVISNLIVFPVSLVIVQLFRRAGKRKPSKESRPDTHTDTDLLPKKNPAWRKNPKSNPVEPCVAKYHQTKQKKSQYWPWWCVIVAWVLVVVVTLTSTFFVTMYGIQFQNTKTEQWMTSMLISITFSVFVTQPVKVVAVALFFSLLCKTERREDEDEEMDTYKDLSKTLGRDEEYLHRISSTDKEPKEVHMFTPPPKESLDVAREKRVNELKMYEIIREILLYSIFLAILLAIAYNNLPHQSYYIKHNMEKMVALKGHKYLDLKKMRNVTQFWNWAEKGLLPALRAKNWYNNEFPIGMRGFLNDRVSRIMGWAILRQLRVKPERCQSPNIIRLTTNFQHCNVEYNTDDEETSDFDSFWAYNTSLPGNKHFSYISSSSMDSYPYWGEQTWYNGGGYVVELRGSSKTIKEKLLNLKENDWIDRLTRAVFVEFAVYNPSVNLFTFAIILCEFPPTGGIFASYRFQPIRISHYSEVSRGFNIASQALFCLFTLWYIVKEIRKICKQKSSYINYFWNWVNALILTLSLTGIGVYVCRVFLVDKLTKAFQRTHGDIFLNFQRLSYMNEVLEYVIGITVFLASIKFLRLLRFNKRMSLLSSTLRHSSNDLRYFVITFSIVFFSFVQFFYLALSPHLENWSSFVRVTESCVQIVLGKFDFLSMVRANNLTPAFFFLFVLMNTMILVNMLVSILNDSFTKVNSDITLQSNEYEIIDFMLLHVSSWTGAWKSNKVKSSRRESNKVDRKDIPFGKQLTHFPEKIDKLLAGLTEIYAETEQVETNTRIASWRTVMSTLRLGRSTNDRYKKYQVVKTPRT